MSITIFNKEEELSILENNIKKLRKSHDSLSSQFIISDSIKLMLSISESIKHKNDLFGNNVPDELLINIISFSSL
jgi:hypothetical protein